MFSSNERNSANVKKLRNNLNYLVEAIVNVQQSTATVHSSTIDNSRLQSEAIEHICTSMYIQRILHRAELLRKDSAFLMYLVTSRSFDYQCVKLMDFLDDDSELFLLVNNYIEDRIRNLSYRKQRNQKFSQDLRTYLTSWIIALLFISIIAYIVFSAVVSSLANPAVAIAVGQLLLAISFYGGVLGGLGVMSLVTFGVIAWNGADAKIENWKVKRIRESFTQEFSNDADFNRPSRLKHYHPETLEFRNTIVKSEEIKNIQQIIFEEFEKVAEKYTSKSSSSLICP